MKKIFLTFLMLIFSFLPFGLTSNISVDATDDVTFIDYYPKSTQLLDLENWFYYRARDLGTYSRKISLSGYKFILEAETLYTLAFNKAIVASKPLELNPGDIFGDEFYFEFSEEDDFFYYYCFVPIRRDIHIHGWYQHVVEFFEFEFESRYDATLEPDILDYELSQLMILHKDLPKESYTLEDFKYKHPLDDTSPVFEGDTYFITNVNNPFTLEAILSHIVVWDDEDGYIDPVVVEDNYSSNRNRIGSYTIKLEASDTSGNTSELVITVMVVDVDAPEIIGPSWFSASMTQKLTVEEIKSKYQVVDNYDTELSLSIIEDEYQANWNIPGGPYKVVLRAVDSSGNEAFKEIQISVFDGVKPVIEGPSVIVKNNNEVLTLSDIIALFTASDNVDGDITNSIWVVRDNYTGFGHKVGEYKIVLAVADSSDNYVEHEVTIKVLDKIPPVFYIDNFLINVQSGVVLTKQQIVDLLIATGQLEASGITYVNFVLNEYEGNENVAGVYNLKLSAVSTDGSEKAFDLQVKVLEVEDNINPIIVETKNFFEKVWKHILENWYWYLLGLIILLLILRRTRYRRY